MPIYLFTWNMLAWSITVAVLWPVMFPWARVTYSIWNGNKEVDEEIADELWIRSGIASFLLTLGAVVFLALDYVTVDQLDFPPGPIHIVFYVCFLAFSAWVMLYSYSLEDFFQGLSMTIIYLYLPTALLFVAWFISSERNWLFRFVRSWLKMPTE